MYILKTYSRNDPSSQISLSSEGKQHKNKEWDEPRPSMMSAVWPASPERLPVPCRGKSYTSAELGLSKTQPPGHADCIPAPQEKAEPFLTPQCSPSPEIEKTACFRSSCVFSVDVMKSKEERKYLASTSPHSPSVREVRAGSRRQELMQTVEGCCLLVNKLLMACSACFLQTRGPPAQLWYHLQLDGFSPINH